MTDKIIIKGAKQHNLKNIDLEIPKNKLVVFSGVSGSGKSSLAMDTIYAEGQRRYVESLSSYARQFLGVLPRPEVEKIEGLSPAIAIDQHSLSHNPRSTVGTVTEIYDYLRVLFARIGHPHCPSCGREVAKQTAEQITKQILKWAEKELKDFSQTQLRIMILSPVVRDKKGEFNKLFENLKKKGFEQVRIDGKIYNLTENFVLIKTNRHNIEVIVDKISLNLKNLNKQETFSRIKDDVEISLDLADGLVILSKIEDSSFSFPLKPEKMSDFWYSSRFACPICNVSLPEIEPRIFSFNSPFGACPECNGLGIKLKIDTSRVSPWRAQELENRYYKTTSEIVREEIEKLMIKEVCPLCKGTRLKKESLTITINGLNIAELSSLSLKDLYQWVKNLPLVLESNKEKEVASSLLREINLRLEFLIAVGVDYLTLDRASATLSAGEGQRIRLASQLGSGLTGVLYVLDEPTVGLHPRDIQKLINTLKDLKNLGNTLIVVEHDKQVINQADWIVEFGPGAGKNGGQIIAQGTPQEIKNNPSSLTGAYLSGKRKVPILPKRNNFSNWISLKGCRTHNLKNIEIKFPLGSLTVVTGVSGSGKSSLVIDTLYPALRSKLDPFFKEKGGKFSQIEGVENINRVFLVDQSPIGRTSRSNPATYIGVFTDIRQLFAQTKEAKLRGFTATHFSFNTPGGRCEACEGQGKIRVQMQFLPDIWVECEECQGKRFQKEVLEVDYKEKNIAEVLELTIKEAEEFFSSHPLIIKKLKILEEIGLDYLELGQPSPTLSGGESQRLKLARELVKKSEGKTIYILDEPTTGLHFADLEKLIKIFRDLTLRGDTVVIIEHNLDLIKQADWIIDLGPEGGEEGGRVVTQGPLKEIINHPSSWTGKFLKKIFE
ncbi:MAG: excinuclease ABC subunit UvrA [Microgenomates group bacterium]